MRKAHIPFPEIGPVRKRPPAKKTPIAPPALPGEDDPAGNQDAPIIPFDLPLPQKKEPEDQNPPSRPIVH